MDGLFLKVYKDWLLTAYVTLDRLFYLLNTSYSKYTLTDTEKQTDRLL